MVFVECRSIFLLLLKLTDFSVEHCFKWLFNSDISHFVIPAQAGMTGRISQFEFIISAVLVRASSIFSGFFRWQFSF